LIKYLLAKQDTVFTSYKRTEEGLSLACTRVQEANWWVQLECRSRGVNCLTISGCITRQIWK